MYLDWILEERIIKWAFSSLKRQWKLFETSLNVSKVLFYRKTLSSGCQLNIFVSKKKLHHLKLVYRCRSSWCFNGSLSSFMDHEFSKIFNKSMALFEISVKNSSWYVDRYSSIFKNDSHEHSCVLNSMFTFLKRSETLKTLYARITMLSQLRKCTILILRSRIE